MASQSFYRKWRSQTFADLVGQPHVTRTLRNALQMQRIAHAYLFCGPRGVGKTSVARILAKAINCLEPREGEPCNECSMCKAITEGRALDVIEIDAASNRRIEEMRDLREKVKFAPSDARYKVYILDEAHMLTGEASNALLKTLEEPPPRTVFILVTTEAHKIQETIVSRCQRFNFRRIPPRDTVERLQQVCSSENLSVSPEALALIARTATGSLRDAEGLLDQLVAYCGREIGYEQAADILGLAGDESASAFADHVLAGEVGSGLTLINQLADNGVELRRFAEGFVGYLRGVLLIKGGAGQGVAEDVTSERLEAMRRSAERVGLDQLVTLIRIFSEAEQGTRGSIAPQLALELALVEGVLHLQKARAADLSPTSTERHAALPSSVPSGEALSRRSGPLVAAPASPLERPANRAKPADVAAVPARSSLHLGEPAAAQPPKLATPTQGDQIEERDAPPAVAGRDAGTLFENLRDRWGEVVEATGAHSKPIQALLRSCGPYAARGGKVIIGCESVFHRDRLSSVPNLALLAKAIAEVTGAPVPLEFEVVPRDRRGQPPPVATDPLVKEVLSWGGRIKSVVPRANSGSSPPAESGEEVIDEP